jgi:hypothetical protein
MLTNLSLEWKLQLSVFAARVPQVLLLPSSLSHSSFVLVGSFFRRAFQSYCWISFVPANFLSQCLFIRSPDKCSLLRSNFLELCPSFIVKSSSNHSLASQDPSDFVADFSMP